MSFFMNVEKASGSLRRRQEAHLHTHMGHRNASRNVQNVCDTSKVDNLSQACPLEGSNLRGDQ